MKPEPLPPLLFPPAPRSSATPRPPVGVISWNMNTTCNYRCSYCTQRFMERRDQWANDTEAFLDAFARLPGTWEIKLSGGEPFRHPTFFEIVEALAQQGHLLSVVSNFSAPRAQLERFVQACGGRARVFSASLHLEYVRAPQQLLQFQQTATWLHGALAPGGAVCVTCVATPRNLPLLPSVAAAFAGGPVPFKVQPEKRDREVIAYSEEQTRALLALGGHNRTGVIKHDMRGKPCWAGSRYFVLDHRGAAYRCYPARRYRVETMGSFLAPSFALSDEPAPCLYPTCHCTVPIERNMMPRTSR